MHQSMDQGPSTQKDWCSLGTSMTSASGSLGQRHKVEMKKDNTNLNWLSNYMKPSGNGTVSTSSSLSNCASGNDGSLRYPEEELDMPTIPGLGDVDFLLSDDPSDSAEPSKPKLTSEGELSMPTIPGLGDDDFLPSDGPSDSAEPPKPKLTSEEATDILLHFGLRSEDLEYLVSCPEDQITRTKLPLILHQLRLQNEKRAATEAQSQTCLEPQLTRTASEEDSLQSSGGTVIRQEETEGIQSSQVINHGLARKQMTEAGDDHGGQSDRETGGGNENTYRMDIDHRHHQEPLQKSITVFGSSEEVASSSTSLCATGRSELSPESPSSGKTKQSLVFSNQTFHSIMNILSLTTIDTNLSGLYSETSNPAAFNQQVVEGQSTCKNQLPSNLLHGTHFSQTSQLRSDNYTIIDTNDPSQRKSTGPIIQYITKQRGAKVEQKLQKAVQQIQEQPKEWTEMPKMNTLSPTEQVGKTKDFGKMVPCPGVLPIQMKLQTQPKDTVAAAGNQPTPEMKYDFAAAKPRHFPHTCVLCKKECADMKIWNSHLVSLTHRDSCRLLRRQYPKWNGYVEAGPRVESEGSPPSNLISAAKTRKGSSSCSNSPSPHRYHSSEGKDNKRRSRSPSPQSFRAKHSSHSRSVSPEKKHSPKRKDARTSSPQRSDRRSPQRRGLESSSDDDERSPRRTYESRPLKRKNDQRQSPPRKVVRKRSPPRREDSSRSPPRREDDGRSPPRRVDKGRLLPRREYDRRSPPRREYNRRSPPRRKDDRRSPPRKEDDGRSPPRREYDRRSPPRSEDDRRSPPRRVNKGRLPLRRGGPRWSPQRRRDDSRSPPMTHGRRSYREEWSPQRKRSNSTESLAKQILNTAGVQLLSSQSDVEALVKTLAPALMAEFAKLTSSRLPSKEETHSLPLSDGGQKKYSSSPSSSKTVSPPPSSASSSSSSSSLSSTKKMQKSRINKCKVKLQGVPKHLNSKDVNDALEHIGKTRSIIIHRPKMEATITFEREEDAERFRSFTNISVKGEWLTVVKAKVAVTKKASESPLIEPASSEDPTQQPPPLGSKKVKTSKPINQKPATKDPAKVVRTVRQAKALVSKAKNVSTKTTAKTKTIRKETANGKKKTAKANQEPVLESNTTNPENQPNSCDSKEKPDTSEASSEGPEVGLIEPVVFNMLANSPVSTPEAGPSRDEEVKAEMISTAQSASKEEDKLVESRSDVKLQTEETDAKADGAPAGSADPENQPHEDKPRQRETSIQEPLNIHKGITESVKTSPPTMVKLHGIDKSLSHSDVLLAVEDFGKTKSVVLFRARSEAVVIFEKEEDAKRLKMAESIDVNGLAITIIKEAVSKEERTSPQKKPESKDKTVFSFSHKSPKSVPNITDERVLIPEIDNVPAQLMVKLDLLALVGDEKTALENQKTSSDSKSRSTEIQLDSGDSKQTLLPEKPISVVKEPAVEDKPIVAEPAKDMTAEAKATEEAVSTKQAKVPVDNEQPTGQSIEEAVTQDVKTNPTADKEIPNPQQSETEVQAPLKVPEDSAVVQEKKEETSFEQIAQGKLDEAENADLGEPMEVELAEPVDTRITNESKDKDTHKEAMPEDTADKTKECQQTKKAENSSKALTQVQQITVADPESTKQEPKTWAGASQEQHQATRGTKVGVKTVTPSGEAAQKGTSKESMPPIKEVSAVLTVAPSSVKTKPTAASVGEKKPTESKPAEPKRSADNQPTVGEMLHVRLFPQRISCIPRQPFLQSGYHDSSSVPFGTAFLHLSQFLSSDPRLEEENRIPNRKQLLMCGLPMYSDGVYTEDDVAQLLYPYGLINKAFGLYVIPQARMAFITLSSWEQAYYLMRNSAYEGIYFRGLRLIFDLHQRPYTPSPAQFYTFLKKEMNCSQNAIDEAERTVLIRGLSLWEARELREALRDFAPVSNFMPILNKLFIEFQFIEDTLRFQNWYCCLKQVSGCNVSLLKRRNTMPPVMTQKVTATTKNTLNTTENVPAAVKGMVIAVKGPGTSDQKLPAAKDATMKSVAEDFTVVAKSEAPENQPGTCASNQKTEHDKPKAPEKQPNASVSNQTLKLTLSEAPEKKAANCVPEQRPIPAPSNPTERQPGTCAAEQQPKATQSVASGKQPASCLPNQSLKLDKPEAQVKQPDSRVPNQTPKPAQSGASGKQPASCLPNQSLKLDKPEAQVKQPDSRVPNQTPKPAQSGGSEKQLNTCVLEQKQNATQSKIRGQQPASRLPNQSQKPDKPEAQVKQPDPRVPNQSTKLVQSGAPQKQPASHLPDQSPKLDKPEALAKQPNSSVPSQTPKPAQSGAPGKQPATGVLIQSPKIDKPEAQRKQPDACVPNQKPELALSGASEKKPDACVPNLKPKAALSGPPEKQPVTRVPEQKPKPDQSRAPEKQSGSSVQTQKPKPDQSGAPGNLPDTCAPSKKYEPEKCDTSVNEPEVGPKKTPIVNKSKNIISGPGLMLKDTEKVDQCLTGTISEPDKDLDKVLVSTASAAQKSRSQIDLDELADSGVETNASKNVKTEQDVSADSENRALGISLKDEPIETTIQKSVEMSNKTDPVAQEANMIVVEQGEQGEIDKTKEEDEPMELGVSGVPIPPQTIKSKPTVNSASALAQVQQSIRAEPESPMQEPKTRTGASEVQQQAAGWTNEAAVEEELPDEKTQTTARKGSLAAEMTEMDSASTRASPSEDVQVAAVSVITKPTVAAASEQMPTWKQPSTFTKKTIGEDLEGRLFPQLIYCFPASYLTPTKYYRSVLIDGLPIYHDGLYTEDDVADLFIPYGLKSKEMLYVIPQTCMAFVTMPEAADVLGLMKDSLKGINFKGKRLRFRIIHNSIPLTRCYFYKFLKRVMKCPNYGDEEKTVLIYNISSKEVSELREALKTFGHVSNFMPLLNKLFIQFGCVKQAKRFGVWYHHLNQGHKFIRLTQVDDDVDMDLNIYWTPPSSSSTCSSGNPATARGITDDTHLTPGEKFQHYFTRHKLRSLICKPGKSSKMLITWQSDDGSYTEEDFIELLTPFGYQHKVHNIYVVPQVHLAFVWMPTPESATNVIIAAKQDPIILKGSELGFFSTNFSISLNLFPFYKSLNILMGNSVGEKLQRIIFIRDISPTETRELREVLKSICPIRNFLPLLNKVFVEFHSICDADLIGVWYSFLKDPPSYRILRLKITPPKKVTERLDTTGFPLDSKVVFEGATLPKLCIPDIPRPSFGPFWLSLKTRPFVFPTYSPWFIIPKFFTINNSDHFKRACVDFPNCQTVMLTNLPEGRYKHEDIAKLVWLDFPKQTLHTLNYNVIVLPLQRRAFVFFPDRTSCHSFLKDVSTREILLKKTLLGAHLVTETMNLESSEEMMYKSMMQWSNAGNPEMTTLKERLLCVEVSEVSLDIIRLVLKMVESITTLVNYLPLGNRICIELKDSSCVAKVMKKYNDLYPNSYTDDPAWSKVVNFETLESLKERINDIGDAHINLESGDMTRGKYKPPTMDKDMVKTIKVTVGRFRFVETSTDLGQDITTDDTKSSHTHTPGNQQELGNSPFDGADGHVKDTGPELPCHSLPEQNWGEPSGSQIYYAVPPQPYTSTRSSTYCRGSSSSSWSRTDSRCLKVLSPSTESPATWTSSTCASEAFSSCPQGSAETSSVLYHSRQGESSESQVTVFERGQVEDHIWVEDKACPGEQKKVDIKTEDGGLVQEGSSNLQHLSVEDAIPDGSDDKSLIQDILVKREETEDEDFPEEVDRQSKGPPSRQGDGENPEQEEQKVKLEEPFTGSYEVENPRSGIGNESEPVESENKEDSTNPNCNGIKQEPVVVLDSSDDQTEREDNQESLCAQICQNEGREDIYLVGSSEEDQPNAIKTESKRLRSKRWSATARKDYRPSRRGNPATKASKSAEESPNRQDRQALGEIVDSVKEGPASAKESPLRRSARGSTLSNNRPVVTKTSAKEERATEPVLDSASEGSTVTTRSTRGKRERTSEDVIIIEESMLTRKSLKKLPLSQEDREISVTPQKAAHEGKQNEEQMRKTLRSSQRQHEAEADEEREDTSTLRTRGQLRQKTVQSPVRKSTRGKNVKSQEQKTKDGSRADSKALSKRRGEVVGPVSKRTRFGSPHGSKQSALEPDNLTGTEFVVPAYFCSLCSVFYQNDADEPHCSSRTHLNNLQKHYQGLQQKP